MHKEQIQAIHDQHKEQLLMLEDQRQGELIAHKKKVRALERKNTDQHSKDDVRYTMKNVRYKRNAKKSIVLRKL